MSVQRQSVPSNDEDLDSTAELPVLEVAELATEHGGSTDTWVMPSGLAALAVPPVDPSAEDRSIQLEINLRALSTSLKDVEERLTRKGERLNELERELASTRDERAAADARALALTQELAQTQSSLAASAARSEELRLAVEAQDVAARSLRAREADLDAKLAARDRTVSAAQQEMRELKLRNTGYLETLRSLEGRRSIFDGLLRGLDHDVSDLRAQLDSRNARVAVLEKDVSELGAALAQRDGQIKAEMRLAAERNESVATLTATVAARDASISALAAAALAQTETLAARQRELDRALAQTHTQAQELTTVEAALAAANLRIAEDEAAAIAALGLRNTMEGAIGEQRQRVARLEAELATITSERDERLTAMHTLQVERDQQATLLVAANARVIELETERVDQVQTITALQNELRTSVERAHDLEGDLRAAEDSIHRLEVDLRAKTARLDEFAKTQDDSRGLVEKARRTLAERDLLMNRLESEAAASQALLGNIQQGIKRLDPNAISGTHEAAPEGAARLLVRIGDGGSEVVHMLGRKTTIGRTPDNDLMIDAKFISRHHAMILAGPTHTIIEDLKSTNGVLVNGRRITRQTLKDGDIVLVGKAQFRFAVRPTTDRH